MKSRLSLFSLVAATFLSHKTCIAADWKCFDGKDPSKQVPCENKYPAPSSGSAAIEPGSKPARQPKATPVDVLAARAMAAGNFPEAERLFREAVALNPDDNYLWRSLGWTVFKSGRIREAETIFRDCLAENGKDRLVRELLAGTLYHRAFDLCQIAGRCAEALPLLKEAAKLDPLNMKVREALREFKNNAGKSGDSQMDAPVAVEIGGAVFDGASTADISFFGGAGKPKPLIIDVKNLAASHPIPGVDTGASIVAEPDPEVKRAAEALTEQEKRLERARSLLKEATDRWIAAVASDRSMREAELKAAKSGLEREEQILEGCRTNLHFALSRKPGK